MFAAFSTALSALSADSAAIDVTGNNLANLNTSGFKASEVNFSELMSQSIGAGSSSSTGLGVSPITSNAVYTQGSITSTSNTMDAAIQGNGFFVVKDASTGTQLYTRDGSFTTDSSGNLITQTGQYVQGWTATNGVIDTNASPGNITVPTGSIAPVATTTMSMDVNLNSGGTVGASSGTVSAPITVYDETGASHTLTATFTKTAADTWDYSVSIPDADVASSPAAALATGTLTFSSSGVLTSPAAGSPVSLSVPALADGAGATTVTWNLFDSSGNPQITQYSQSSGVSSTTQDGSAAGQVTGVSITDGGMVTASYSNGKTATLGELAVASIRNPQSLVSVGDNNLQASATTSAPAIGTADSGGRGKIVGSSLEASTSDMSSEFTNLLTYERSYQAASRVITTTDQLMQETVNLIHA